jgi:hypothetical protein
MALPITTKQIDGGMLMDPDVSTQRSSSKAFYNSSNEKIYGKNTKGFALKRGKSQQNSAAPGHLTQNVYHENARINPVMSATRRNHIPLPYSKLSGMSGMA